MKTVYLIPHFLIGFSFTSLLYNKIAFGIFLLLGILSLFVFHKKNHNFKFKFNNYKIDLFFSLTILFFLVSSFISIKPERSILVTLYFIIFVIISLNLFFLLIRNEDSFRKISNFLMLSTVINIAIIFFYNLFQSGFFFGDFQTNEIRRFKGILNVITILVILLFFFGKSKMLFFPIIFLLPSLYLSNSNAPILGIIIGIILIILYKMIKKIKINKIKIISFLFILFFLINLFTKLLPSKFDENSIENQIFSIPTSILDPHRQFIWGFSISKFVQKPFLGFGPDASNFIKDGQRVIGSKFTGTMKFIPSHPHNFLIELLLETGLLGTLSFIIFIFLINFKIFMMSNIKQKNFLLFFNGYYWGASLVNFSYWQAWWQGSYFLILCLLASKIVIYNKNKNETF